MQPLQTLCVANAGTTTGPLARGETNGVVTIRCSGQSQQLAAANDPALKDSEVAPGYLVGLHQGRYLIAGPDMWPPQPLNPAGEHRSPSGAVVYKKTVGVAQGIASLLGPLASLGTNIFTTTQQTALERQRIKSGGGAASPGIDPALMAAMMQQPKGPNIGLILGIGVLAVGAVLFIVMSSKKPA